MVIFKTMKRAKSILGLAVLVIFLTTIVDIIMFSSNYIPILNRLETSLFDWDIQDLVYSSDKFKDSKTRCDEIVLVNWGHIDRDSIALLLESIKKYSPGVIGIDAIFFDLKDSVKDNKLKQSLTGCDLVTPIDLRAWSEEKGSFLKAERTNDYFSTSRTSRAFTSFYSYDVMRDAYGTDDESFIRTFSPYEKLNDTAVFCFGYELVKRYDGALFENYLRKHKVTQNEVVRYWGDTSLFKTIGYKDILNEKIERSTLAGKIVILTFLGYSRGDWRNSEGKFTTPLNPRIVGRNKPDMYGGAIHANIALSVLKGVRVRSVSWLTQILTNFSFVFLFMLTLDTIRSKRSEKLPLYGRLTAYTFIVFLMGLGILLYFEFEIKIDFRLAVVYILALPEVYLIYINRVIPYFKEIMEKIRVRFRSKQ